MPGRGNLGTPVRQRAAEGRSGRMKRMWTALARHAAEVLLTVGAAAVSVGAGMVYLPAGLICAGALAIADAVLLCLGGGEED